MNNKGEGKKQLLVLMAVLAVIAFVATTAAATTFLGLTDTPAAYSGSGGEYVRVNAGETALEFVAGGIDFGDYIDLPEAAEPAAPAADNLRLFSLDDNGFSILAFKDSGGMVRKFVKDTVFIGYNNSGSTIAAARIVYASGSTGNVPEISPAKADSSTTMPAVGVTIESIANGAYGRIMQTGILEDVNTSSYSTGDILYVSATTAGIPTSTAPTSPNLRQEIGTILVDDAAVGSIQIVARTAFDDSLIPWRSSTYVLKASDTVSNWANSNATVVGNATDEIQTALNYMLDNGGGVLELTEGTFPFSATAVNYTAGDNLTIQGQGDSTVLDITNVTSHSVNISGLITATSSLLTANASENDISITVANGGLFSINDWIRIRSEADFEDNPASPNKIGEIQRIRDISGNVLTLDTPMLDDYNTLDTATVDLLDMCEGITIKDLRIVGAGNVTDQWGLEIRQAYNVRLENVTIDDVFYIAVYLGNVVAATGDNLRITNANKSGYGLGVAVYDASRNIIIDKMTTERCRHAWTSSYSGDYGISRFLEVNDGSFTGGLETQVGQLLTHYVSEHVTFANNFIVGDRGIVFDSPYGKAIGNTIITSEDQSGILPYIYSHDIEIDNNTMWVGLYGVDMIVSAATPENVTITRNKIYKGLATGSTYGVRSDVDADYLKIGENTFDGFTSHIYIRSRYGGNMTGLEIYDNTYKNATSQNVRLEAHDYGIDTVSISDDIMYANSQTGYYFIDPDTGATKVDHIDMDHVVISDAGIAILVRDRTDNLNLRNATFIDSTTPVNIVVNAAADALFMATNNNWNGCSANLTTGGGLTERISTNVANDGTWYAGDDPG